MQDSNKSDSRGPDLKIGDPVRITEGSFANLHGTIEAIDSDEGEAAVIISIFGRKHRAGYKYNQLEKKVE